MNMLIFLVLLAAPLLAAENNGVKLVVPSQGDGWRDPVYDWDGTRFALTDAAQKQIFIYESGEDSPRSVAKGDRIGRRFVFEPGGRHRIVFRLRSDAIPGKPERLYSSSIYLYDPVPRSHNISGDVYGPYLIENQVWYRFSPFGPFTNYENQLRHAGPYGDFSGGFLYVLNEKEDTVFASENGARMRGAEISPDGRWVAAVQSDPTVKILLVNTEHGTRMDIPDSYAPAWAGDSRSLICVSTANPAQQSLRLVRLPSGEGEFVLSSPEYHPETPALNRDGTRALFVSKGSIYEMELKP
ncbi:hypothetical protein EHM69_12055 [candidate division KSB1 bacterium]|nr:MAG: hypothetical protein EHM69_12055 [candidate division KSB1 bacterium]